MSIDNRTIRIGTRGSPLALKQVEMVREALQAVHPDLEAETVVIRTSGDWSPSDGEVRLSEKAGGKAQFAKEIEEALLDGAIDCAVHSMKDMDSVLPDGLVINHMLPREDVRDCLLFRDGFRDSQSLGDLPENACIGTASVRRAAFLLAKRPDLKIEPLRGNVQTRIDKVRSGQVDASLLAIAGLKRLGLSDEADLVLNIDEMLPAAGQGAVGIEMREGDQEVADIFDVINDKSTLLCVKAERAVLKVLHASCHSPLGVYASLDNDEMIVRFCAARPDGSSVFEDEISESVHSLDEAQALGARFGETLKPKLPSGILE